MQANFDVVQGLMVTLHHARECGSNVNAGGPDDFNTETARYTDRHGCRPHGSASRDRVSEPHSITLQRDLVTQAFEPIVFYIRAITPPVISDSGPSRAAGELCLGYKLVHFLLDLKYWRIEDYEEQWQSALVHLLNGGRVTGLLTAYRWPAGSAHVMWALWHSENFVYVQEHTLLTVELDTAFDPGAVHLYIDARVPVTENDLPIREWRVPSAQVHAAALGFRWPF